MVEVILKNLLSKGRNTTLYFLMRRCRLAVPLMKIIQSIRMTKDENHTLKGTVLHNLGQIQRSLKLGHVIYCGKRRVYQKQSSL